MAIPSAWPVWTEKDIPDLSGRVAVVTGGNGGLGLATCIALAGAGAHVVMAARDQTKAASAVEAVRAAAGGSASVDVVPLDLGDLTSVRSAASKISESHPAIDILVNNAGLMAMPERATADGFEMQFGVNHLGHWALTALLMPRMLAAPGARVVTVSSVARFTGRPVDPSNPHMRGRYRPWLAYGQAKKANYHFAIGLHRRFASAGVAASSLAAHPGLTNSDLQTRSAHEGGGGILSQMSVVAARAGGMSIKAGARPQLRAATDPGARSGELYGPAFGGFGPAVRRPVLEPGLDRRIAELWELSERETGMALEV